MTFPTHFRRSAPIPKSLVLHPPALLPSEVEIIDGVPATRALRTLLDVAMTDAVPIEDLRTAFAAALRTGKIIQIEIDALKSDPTRYRILCELHQAMR